MCVPAGSATWIAAPHTASSASSAARARLSFVYADWASLYFSSIQLFDGGIGGLIRRHLDKAEPAGSVGRPIHDDLRTVNVARLSKDITQVLVRHSPSQIPNVQSAAHSSSLLGASNALPIQKPVVLLLHILDRLNAKRTAGPLRHASDPQRAFSSMAL
jgi:hypothetical protein